jgi:hypothetical protein
MLDGGAGQARRLEAVLRDASTTRATCIVAAAASFCQLVDDPDLHLTDALCRQCAPATIGDRGIATLCLLAPDIPEIIARHSGMVPTGRRFAPPDDWLRTRPQMCNCTSGNLEIPGSRGACHRARIRANPLARPGMTVESTRAPE